MQVGSKEGGGLWCAYLADALLLAANLTIELFVFALLGYLVAFAAEALDGDEVGHSSILQ